MVIMKLTLIILIPLILVLTLLFFLAYEFSFKKINFLNLSTKTVKPAFILPPKNVKSIVAIYNGRWFGPCNDWIIYYMQMENQYTKRQSCRENPSPSSKQDETISKEDFESNIFIDQYFNRQNKSNYVSINITDILSPLKLHADSSQCWKSKDGTEIICANNEGVIVDRYLDYSNKGVMDANQRFTLGSFERVLSQDYCEAYDKQIKKFLDQLNSCKKDDDCITTELGCPLGCYNLVNKNVDFVLIENMAKEYHKDCGQCIYKCGVSPIREEIHCLNNKCVDTGYKTGN